MKLKLYQMIKPELELLKENCNFTEEEMMVFECLCKGYTRVQISDTTNLSVATVKRRIAAITEKVERTKKVVM